MRRSFVVWFVLLAALPTFAQPSADPPENEEPADRPAFTDVVVVTASGSEQRLHEAPASMTVIDAERIEALPADGFGDLLKTVPGLNVAQLSAGDTQVVGRQAATSVATSELVLVDGRSVYLDFFGFVLWSFVPVDPSEIRQIEVVRGPGSAVWGANALAGVINLITKSPREMVGTQLSVGGGNLGTFTGSVAHAGVRDAWSWKLGGGYFEQDAFPRPSGLIPGTTTPYPAFDNAGTRQPRLHLRLDHDATPSSSWSLSAGYAGADGILHTGLGPFRIPSGSGLGFVKVDRVDGSRRIGFYANLLDGEGDNLLTIGPDGRPLAFDVESQTYDLAYSDVRVLRERHVLTWGLSARRSEFDLTIAPDGEDRDELGAFLQDDILLGDRVRWTVGARWDDIDPIGSVVSPRTNLALSPAPGHTVRLSYNRAFRAPSLLNTSMDTAILTPLLLPAVPPFLDQPTPYAFPSLGLGDPDLSEERLEAFELGYIGDLGSKSRLTLAVYRNETEDSIDFFPATFYGPANPPPGFPLPAFFLDLPPLAGSLPSSFSFRNVGRVVDRGFEASLDVQATPRWAITTSYAYQDDPRADGIPESELNRPPEHRGHVTVAYRGDRLQASASAQYVDDAFWTDVLDSRFWGPTDDYTQVDLRIGLPLAGDTAGATDVRLSLNVQNLFDERLQQHVFGDLLERKAWVEARLDF